MCVHHLEEDVKCPVLIPSRTGSNTESGAWLAPNKIQQPLVFTSHSARIAGLSESILGFSHECLGFEGR